SLVKLLPLGGGVHRNDRPPGRSCDHPPIHGQELPRAQRRPRRAPRLNHASPGRKAASFRPSPPRHTPSIRPPARPNEDWYFASRAPTLPRETLRDGFSRGNALGTPSPQPFDLRTPPYFTGEGTTDRQTPSRDHRR